MTFDYLERVVVEGQLDVENIGDCVLLGRNDLGEEFYLVIKTELGWTEVVDYGPCTPDLNMLPLNYNIKYSRFEYNQSKLERLIDKFLNDPKKFITQANVTTIDSIYPFLVNPIDKMFFNNGGMFDE